MKGKYIEARKIPLRTIVCNNLTSKLTMVKIVLQLNPKAMKNEKLYQGMTEDVAKRYLVTLKTIDGSLDTLRGISQLCGALVRSDGEAIEIAPCCMKLISKVTEEQVSILYRMLVEEFVDTDELREALEKCNENQ